MKEKKSFFILSITNCLINLKIREKAIESLDIAAKHMKDAGHNMSIAPEGQLSFSIKINFRKIKQ